MSREIVDALVEIQCEKAVVGNFQQRFRGAGELRA